MEIKSIIIISFVTSLFVAIFCTNRAGKNTVENIDKLIDDLPMWKKLFYGLLEIYPYYMLNSIGRKWQTAAYVMLIPMLISGIEIGKLVEK